MVEIFRIGICTESIDKFHFSVNNSGKEHERIGNEGDDSILESARCVEVNTTSLHRNRKVVYRVGYSLYAHTITNGMLAIGYNQH